MDRVLRLSKYVRRVSSVSPSSDISPKRKRASEVHSAKRKRNKIKIKKVTHRESKSQRVSTTQAHHPSPSTTPRVPVESTRAPTPAASIPSSSHRASRHPPAIRSQPTSRETHANRRFPAPAVGRHPSRRRRRRARRLRIVGVDSSALFDGRFDVGASRSSPRGARGWAPWRTSVFSVCLTGRRGRAGVWRALRRRA